MYALTLKNAGWLISALALLTPPVLADETAQGWSLGTALRLRSEYLADSFRLVAPGEDLLLFSRLELDARYRDGDWSARVELQDSRAWGDARLSPIGTDDVNALEPVNLSIGRRWSLGDATQAELRVGRMTVNYGSRRLLARNRFRNTSNAFQGAMFEYRAPGYRGSILYSYPLQRRPNILERDALRDNDFKWDYAGRDERFWAVMQDLETTDASRQLQLYLLGSEVTGTPSRPAADRDLLTAGLRGKGARGAFEWEVEAAYQWGDYRDSSRATGDRWLTHRAWFTHLHGGFEVLPGWTLQLAYDQASGDRAPDDNRNERFDRLYGARAFELGPSGIFGAAIRSNLRAPALRLLWEPGGGQRWLFSYRQLSLDSATDAFITGSRRDSTGSSGRDIGGQWEARWRWKPAAGGLSYEIGAALLDKGRFFAGSAQSPILNPLDSNPENSRYLFAQLIWQR